MLQLPSLETLFDPRAYTATATSSPLASSAVSMLASSASSPPIGRVSIARRLPTLVSRLYEGFESTEQFLEYSKEVGIHPWYLYRLGLVCKYSQRVVKFVQSFSQVTPVALRR